MRRLIRLIRQLVEDHVSSQLSQRQRIEKIRDWTVSTWKEIRTISSRSASKIIKEGYIGGDLVPYLPISEEMMAVAKDVAEKIEEAVKKRQAKDVFPGNIESRIASVLGEFAVAEYLLADWRKAIPPIISGTHEADIMIQDETFDVKTATLETHHYLAVPTAKFNAWHHDYYVGCHLRRGGWEVWLRGYATRKEVGLAGMKNLGYALAYCILLERLHPIDDLLRRAQRARKGGTLLDYMPCIAVAGADDRVGLQ